MARRDRKKAKGNVVRVDFSEVSSNVLLPESVGVRFKVLAATHKDNDGDGSIMVKSEVLKADNKKLIGKTPINYFNLGESSLWVLRNFLDALGVEIPEGPMDIDLDELVDREFVADITQNTYNDRTTNRLANFAMSDDNAEESEDDDEVVVKGKKPRKDEDEEDEEPKKRSKKSREDEEDEDEQPRKKSKKSVDEDDDEEEEKPRKKKSRNDEEDEDEAPKKKSKKSYDEDEEEDEEPKKKPKKSVNITEDEVRDMDEKELKALVKKHDLDVDFDDYPNLRKKVLAVVKALEEEGLLDE